MATTATAMTTAAMPTAAMAAATAVATATATAMAAGRGLDQGTTRILLIEEMEGRDAGVGELFLTQHDRVSLR
jgi:hypothetical protein